MDRLEKARAYLVIAESKDSKRKAYMMAAEEIAAYKAETGDTWECIAMHLQRNKRTLLKIEAWRKSGYETNTPFVASEKERQAITVSHAKRAIRELPPEKIKEIGDELARPMLMTRAAMAAGPTGIIAQLAIATGDLREVIEYGLVSPELLDAIQEKLDEFQREFDFAKQLIGGK